MTTMSFKTLRRVAASAAFAVSLAGMALAEGVASPSKAIETYMAAVNAGDADAVAALYHEDAVLLGPDGSTIQGREAIRGANARNFAAGKTTLEIGKPLTDFGDRKGIMLYPWQLTIAPDGKDPIVLRGRSMLGWAKQGEAWFITADMFHVLN